MKYYLKWTSNPEYMSQKNFDNDLVAIHKSKVTLLPSKPTYVGMPILDLTKVLMYEFHYDYIKIKYGINSRLSEDSNNLILFGDEIGILSVELEKINLHNVNFHKDEVKAIIHGKLMVWGNRFKELYYLKWYKQRINAIQLITWHPTR